MAAEVENQRFSLVALAEKLGELAANRGDCYGARPSSRVGCRN